MAASTDTESKPPANQNWESRAVLRLIEAGSIAECPHCGERVKFRARHRDQQVICNVYESSVWKRVEQFHEHCYEEADKPYGEPIHKPMRRKSRSAKPPETSESSTDGDSSANDAASTADANGDKVSSDNASSDKAGSDKAGSDKATSQKATK